MADPTSDEQKLVLYQWPASAYCDSIYVRCTKVQRLLGLLRLDYEVADIAFPTVQNDAELSEKVKPLMRRIPILKVGETNYMEETPLIVRYLLDRAGYDGFEFTNGDDRVKSILFEHFAERWLAWHVIYARWVREDNYQRFFLTFADEPQRERIKRAVDYTRRRAAGVVKGTEIGQMTESEYLKDLERSLELLEDTLQNRDFILGNEIKECDLSLFMCVQAFYDPSLSAERKIAVGFRKLHAWARKIDALTQTRYSKKLL